MGPLATSLSPWGTSMPDTQGRALCWSLMFEEKTFLAKSRNFLLSPTATGEIES